MWQDNDYGSDEEYDAADNFEESGTDRIAFLIDVNKNMLLRNRKVSHVYIIVNYHHA